MKNLDLDNLMTPVVDFEWALDEEDVVAPRVIHWCNYMPEFCEVHRECIVW